MSTKRMIPRISRTPITMKTKTQAGKGRTIPLADAHSVIQYSNIRKYKINVILLCTFVYICVLGPT